MTSPFQPLSSSFSAAALNLCVCVCFPATGVGESAALSRGEGIRRPAHEGQLLVQEPETRKGRRKDQAPVGGTPRSVQGHGKGPGKPATESPQRVWSSEKGSSHSRGVKNESFLSGWTKGQSGSFRKQSSRDAETSSSAKDNLGFPPPGSPRLNFTRLECWLDV